MIVSIIESTAIAALMAVPVLLLSRTLRRRPGVLHLLWLLVFIRLVIPSVSPAAGLGAVDDVDHVLSLPLAEGGASAYQTANAVGLESRTPVAQAAAAGQEVRTVVKRREAVVRPTDVVSIGGQESLATVFDPVVGLLPFVVLSVGIGVVLVQFGRHGRLRRQIHGAMPDVTIRVQSLAKRIGVRAPRVAAMAGISSPFILCQRRPILVVPDGEEIPESVLAHELAHLARKDHWTARLELIALAVHWWNPLFWFVRGRLREAAEWACDAHAVKHQVSSGTEYAWALVTAVERSRRPVASTALAFGGHARAFEDRLRLILDGDLAPRVPRALLFPLLGVFLLTLPPWMSWTSERVLAAPACAQAKLPPEETALLKRFGAESWCELRESAVAVLKETPQSGVAWHRLGFALLATGDFSRAAQAFQRQAELGFQLGLARYNEACALARADRGEEALAILEVIVRQNPQTLESVRIDPDFDGLRGQQRFRRLLQL